MLIVQIRTATLPSSALPSGAIRNVYAFYSQHRGLISIKQVSRAPLPSSALPSMAIRNVYAFCSPHRGLTSTWQMKTATLPSSGLPIRAIQNVYAFCSLLPGLMLTRIMPAPLPSTGPKEIITPNALVSSARQVEEDKSLCRFSCSPERALQRREARLRAVSPLRNG